MNPFVEEIVERTAAAGLDPSIVRGLLAVPPEESMGDYALPCFTLARELRRNPAQIAADVAERILPGIGPGGRIAAVAAAGPYVNFTLDRPAFIGHTLDEIAALGPTYGSRGQGAGRSLALDFSSPNLARPFSIAHLRSTAIGHAIYRIHEFLGWRCVGINYYGDYGANFGQLLAAYAAWGDEERIRADPIRELVGLYVRFHREAEADPGLRDRARDCLRALASGDEEMVRLWRWFSDEGRKEAERIYGILGVRFDEVLGESHFAGQLDDVVAFFGDRGLAEESEGALIVPLEDQAAPLMLRTSNGTSTYHSRDVAALLYRQRQHDFDKMVYVTDMRQRLHFEQLFGALRRAGVDWIDRCQHAPFGLMSFRGRALATRKGEVIILEDVLDRAIALTEGIIAEKNPGLAGAAEVARQVGISAVVFADVNNRRTRDIHFSLEEVLNFDGETGPYVQYTHARYCSILRRHGRPVDPAADTSRLGEAGEMRLARKLAEFPDVVDSAAAENEPSYVAGYLLELAAAANKLYNEVPVLVGGDEGLTAARVRLADGARGVLRTGLDLLGMSAPEEM